jgi:hypothetical protein
MCHINNSLVHEAKNGLEVQETNIFEDHDGMGMIYCIVFKNGLKENIRPFIKTVSSLSTS